MKSSDMKGDYRMIIIEVSRADPRHEVRDRLLAAADEVFDEWENRIEKRAEFIIELTSRDNHGEEA